MISAALTSAGELWLPAASGGDHGDNLAVGLRRVQVDDIVAVAVGSGGPDLQPGIVGDDDFTARLGGTGDLGACGVERRNRHVWRRKIDGKVDRLRQTALVACRIGFPQGNRVCAFCQWTRRRDAPVPFGRTVVVPITTPLS